MVCKAPCSGAVYSLLLRFWGDLYLYYIFFQLNKHFSNIFFLYDGCRTIRFRYYKLRSLSVRVPRVSKIAVTITLLFLMQGTSMVPGMPFLYRYTMPFFESSVSFDLWSFSFAISKSLAFLRWACTKRVALRCPAYRPTTSSIRKVILTNIFLLNIRIETTDILELFCAHVRLNMTNTWWMKDPVKGGVS